MHVAPDHCLGAALLIGRVQLGRVQIGRAQIGQARGGPPRVGQAGVPTWIPRARPGPAVSPAPRRVPVLRAPADDRRLAASAPVTAPQLTAPPGGPHRSALPAAGPMGRGERSGRLSHPTVTVVRHALKAWCAEHPTPLTEAAAVRVRKVLIPVLSLAAAGVMRVPVDPTRVRRGGRHDLTVIPGLLDQPDGAPTSRRAEAVRPMSRVLRQSADQGEPGAHQGMSGGRINRPAAPPEASLGPPSGAQTRGARTRGVQRPPREIRRRAMADAEALLGAAAPTVTERRVQLGRVRGRILEVMMPRARATRARATGATRTSRERPTRAVALMRDPVPPKPGTSPAIGTGLTIGSGLMIGTSPAIGTGPTTGTGLTIGSGLMIGSGLTIGTGPTIVEPQVLDRSRATQEPELHPRAGVVGPTGTVRVRVIDRARRPALAPVRPLDIKAPVPINRVGLNQKITKPPAARAPLVVMRLPFHRMPILDCSTPPSGPSCGR